MRKISSVGWIALSAALAVPLSAQDNPISPWGAPFGVDGTAQAAGFPVIFDPAVGTRVAWSLDPTAYGGHTPVNWIQIVFDESGNLYWHSWSWGATDDKVMSVDPDGNVRWVGPDEGLGAGATDVSCVVGSDAVYILGMVSTDPDDGNSYQWVYALSKDDGTVIWKQKLDYEVPGVGINNNQPIPALHDGILYVTGVPDGGATVYLLDAATGDYLNVRTSSVIAEIESDPLFANTIIVPNVFGQGVHGMYVLGTDCGEGDWDKVYGLSVDTTVTPHTVAYEWEAVIDDLVPGWKLAHLAYAADINTLFAYSEGYQTGYLINGLDPELGDTYKDWGWVNDGGLNSSHWQTGAVDYGSDRFFTGASDGRVAAFPIDGSGNVSEGVGIETSSLYGHLRTFSQLLQNGDGHTIMVTGTEDNGGGARMLMVDLDAANTPPAPNGPIYIDDIVVYEGTTTIVLEEDFESMSLGALPGQNGWAETSYDGAMDPVTDPAQIVMDPDGSDNKVLMLMPAGDGYTQSVAKAFTQLTGDVVKISYRQWLTNCTQIREVVLGANPAQWPLSVPYSYGGYWSGLQYAAEWEYYYDGGGQFTGEKEWDEVIIQHDYTNEVSFVAVDANLRTAPWVHPDDGTPQGWAPTVKPDGVSFGCYNFTDTSTNLPGNALAAHRLPARKGYVYAHLLGGPMVGPDGKMYAFITHQSWTLLGYAALDAGKLFAVEPNTPLGICADTNCDGAVNAFDIDPFVVGLVSPATWEATYSCDYLTTCDVNGDGAVNAFDIDPFVIALVNGGCP